MTWTKKKILLALGIAVLAGGAIWIRCWNLFHDLPIYATIDERELVYQSLKFGSGDLNPHEFVWPTFFKYLLFGLYGAAYFAGKWAGVFTDTASFVKSYVVDPSPFYMIGRIATAVLGCLTVFATYRLGKIVSGMAAGITGAVLVAVSPLHVEYCHLVNLDVPMTFFFTVSLALMLAALDENGHRSERLAGVIAGIAMGTKYQAVILVIPLIAIAMLKARCNACTGGYRACAASIGTDLFIMMISFLAVCPFAALDYRTFFSELKDIAQAGSSGYVGWEEPSGGYGVFLRIVIHGIGMPAAVLSLFGMLALTVTKNRKGMVLILAAVSYFMVFGGSPYKNATYARYMVTLMPLLAVSAGAFVTWVMCLLPPVPGRSAVPLMALIAIAIAWSARASVHCVNDLGYPSTLAAAVAWIECHVPRDSRLLVDEEIPSLRNNIEGLRKMRKAKESQRRAFGYRRMTDWFSVVQEAAAASGKTYEITRIPRPVGFLSDSGRFYVEEWVTPEYVRDLLRDYEHRYDYIIITGGGDVFLKAPVRVPDRFRFMTDFYRSLGARCRLVKQIASGGEGFKGRTIAIYAAPRGDTHGG